MGGKQPGLEGCQSLGHGSLRRHAVPVDDLCGGGEGGGLREASSAIWDRVLEWVAMSWGSVWLACLLGQYFVLTEVKL